MLDINLFISNNNVSLGTYPPFPLLFSDPRYMLIVVVDFVAIIITIIVIILNIIDIIRTIVNKY